MMRADDRVHAAHARPDLFEALFLTEPMVGPVAEMYD